MSEAEKTIKCLSEQEMYEEMYSRIHNSKPENKNLGDHLKDIGLCSGNYYFIRSFVNGKPLTPDRKKPMKDSKLKELMQKLGIEFIKSAYIVKV